MASPDFTTLSRPLLGIVSGYFGYDVFQIGDKARLTKQKLDKLKENITALENTVRALLAPRHFSFIGEGQILREEWDHEPSFASLEELQQVSRRIKAFKFIVATAIQLLPENVISQLKDNPLLEFARKHRVGEIAAQRTRILPQKVLCWVFFPRDPYAAQHKFKQIQVSLVVLSQVHEGDVFSVIKKKGGSRIRYYLRANQVKWAAMNVFPLQRAPFEKAIKTTHFPH